MQYDESKIIRATIDSNLPTAKKREMTDRFLKCAAVAGLQILIDRQPLNAEYTLRFGFNVPVTDDMKHRKMQFEDAMDELTEVYA